jgi:hypothetical protein
MQSASSRSGPAESFVHRFGGVAIEHERAVPQRRQGQLEEPRKHGWREFRETVNMTAAELENSLGTEESKKVGQKDGKNESTGHASGRRIVDLLRSKKSELTDDDYAHMRKVIGYAHRHLAQRPSGDITIHVSSGARDRCEIDAWHHI